MSTLTVSRAWLLHGLHRQHALRLFHGLDCFTIPTICTYADLGSRGYFSTNVALLAPENAEKNEFI